jgi:hypothetical protein
LTDRQILFKRPLIRAIQAAREIHSLDAIEWKIGRNFKRRRDA